MEWFLRMLVGLGLKPFKPCAWYQKEMDMVDVMTKDVSYTNHWLGIVCLEVNTNTYNKNSLVGFHIVCVKALQGEYETNSTSTLLLRALKSDWKRRGTWCEKLKKRTLLFWYLRCFLLTLRHRGTWKFS